MHGARNNMSVSVADVGTAFLYGKTTERVYVIAGPEFGPDIAGKKMVIDKGLYGLRSSSARFHEHLSTKLRALGFRPSKADADFWYQDRGEITNTWPRTSMISLSTARSRWRLLKNCRNITS